MEGKDGQSDLISCTGTIKKLVLPHFGSTNQMNSTPSTKRMLHDITTKTGRIQTIKRYASIQLLRNYHLTIFIPNFTQLWNPLSSVCEQTNFQNPMHCHQNSGSEMVMTAFGNPVDSLNSQKLPWNFVRMSSSRDHITMSDYCRHD